MLKVLIAEDQLLIADRLEEALLASNYEVCGIARTTDEGVALGEIHMPDDIARRLNSRGKFGVLYATGDDARHSTLTLADGDASIAKPYRPEDVVRALAIVREISTTGMASRPFPTGFRLLSPLDVRIAEGSLA